LLTPDEIRAAGFSVRDFAQLLGHTHTKLYSLLGERTLSRKEDAIMHMAHVWGRITEQDPKEVYLQWASQLWEYHNEQESREG
jgi:hypothetical protein